MFTKVLLPIFALTMVIAALNLFMKKGVNNNNVKSRVLSQIALFAGVFAICLITSSTSVFADEVNTTVAAGADAFSGSLAQGLGFIAAALVTSCSCIGAAIAVSTAAPAAIGSFSENPANFGKAMIFVALAEGVAIYGLLISILIINKL